MEFIIFEGRIKKERICFLKIIDGWEKGKVLIFTISKRRNGIVAAVRDIVEIVATGTV